MLVHLPLASTKKCFASRSQLQEEFSRFTAQNSRGGSSYKHRRCPLRWPQAESFHDLAFKAGIESIFKRSRKRKRYVSVAWARLQKTQNRAEAMMMWQLAQFGYAKPVRAEKAAIAGSRREIVWRFFQCSWDIIPCAVIFIALILKIEGERRTHVGCIGDPKGTSFAWICFQGSGNEYAYYKRKKLI